MASQANCRVPGIFSQELGQARDKRPQNYPSGKILGESIGQDQTYAMLRFHNNRTTIGPTQESLISRGPNFKDVKKCINM